MTLIAALRELAGASVGVTLLGSGFVSNKFTYCRRLPQLSWIIEIQLSRWSTKAKASFTINCGVYVPGFMCIYAARDDSPFPREVECVIRGRPSMFSGAKRDKWWSISEACTPTMRRPIVSDMQTVVSSMAMPFLSTFTDRKATIKFLSEPRPPEYDTVHPISEPGISVHLAILHWLESEKVMAESCMSRAERNCKSSEFMEVLSAIRGRMDLT